MSVLRWAFTVGACSVFVFALRDNSETDGNDALFAAVVLSPLVGAAALGWFDRTRSVLTAAICTGLIVGGIIAATGATARERARDPDAARCTGGFGLDETVVTYDPCPQSLRQQTDVGFEAAIMVLILAAPPHGASLCWRRRRKAPAA